MFRSLPFAAEVTIGTQWSPLVPVVPSYTSIARATLDADGSYKLLNPHTDVTFSSKLKPIKVICNIVVKNQVVIQSPNLQKKTQ